MNRIALFTTVPLMMLSSPSTTASPADESSACDITIRARNSSNLNIGFSQSTSSGYQLSQVRTRVGYWSGLSIPPAGARESYQHVLKLSLYCNAARRYRFRLQKGGVQYTYYYPSSSTFTQSTTLELGDLNRFF